MDRQFATRVSLIGLFATPLLALQPTACAGCTAASNAASTPLVSLRRPATAARAAAPVLQLKELEDLSKEFAALKLGDKLADLKLGDKLSHVGDLAQKALQSQTAPEGGATTTTPAGGALSELPSVDWSFIDAAYVITCPQPDGQNPRLDTAWKQLEAVGLASRTEVCEFGTDDEDRIRGCYTSHITVLEKAAAKFEGKEDLNILVLEDNLSISPRIAQDTLDSISAFLSAPGLGRRDMVHLAYIMYVPGLSVETLPNQEHIVRLQCNADSVLGTTAYVISRSGLDTLLGEHRRTGYVDAIPNMMARLFPDT